MKILLSLKSTLIQLNLCLWDYQSELAETFYTNIPLNTELTLVILLLCIIPSVLSNYTLLLFIYIYYSTTTVPMTGAHTLRNTPFV